LHACITTREAFWGWDLATWLDVFGPDYKTIQDRFPGWVDGAVRPYMFAMAYVLNCFSEIHQLGKNNNVTLATRLFGPALVEAAVEPIVSTLAGWGYQSARHTATVPGLVCSLLMLNRSPHLADMTTEKIEYFRRSDAIPSLFRSKLYGVHRALAALGFVETPASYIEPHKPVIEGVNPEWLRWVERWTATSTLTLKVRQMYRSILLKVGRWLVSEHPEIQDPSQWTRQLCADYLAMVQQVCVGDYVQRRIGLGDRLGEPLSPRSKASYIVVLRAFFRDCQEWEWIPRRFNPTQALATPRSILALTGPQPRVIADELWAKLLWAGLNLEADDLPTSAGGHFYPLELMRALALIWLFGGLRSDEIVRLPVGCIRWQTTAQEGEAQTVCYLDVPPNKTGHAFTKPVDPLVGKAIAAWEAVRPEQPTLLDRRTGERVHFLFCYRARHVAKQYLNQGLIPILCHKAGIPRSDVRGPITSHRARATIATQLYNAKEPMTLFQLQAWLGHRSPETTQFYARITPTTLAKAYTDADYFARNVRTIEVLIDREAIATGAAANGTPWQYFDLGHGYCTYTFFEQCPHRMACARCDFYLPKNSTKSQLLEAKDNLQQMLAMIPLNDEERAAVEDGKTALDQLLEHLIDVPTPSGPTPRQLTQGGELVIPLQPTQAGSNGQKGA
jgi:integrase